ncbi:MAG TPA: alpha/beta hydrolase [Ktedonobacterales bacterium]|nr:alpha/beta hydrolase [Ktedonobacterales bacterium]
MSETGDPGRAGGASAAPVAAARRDIVRSIHYTLSYTVQNAASGPRGAIVLLHDLPGGAFVWEPIMAPLAATGRAVYAFDMLGYGQSDKPWPSDTSVWGHADCLKYALETLGLDNVTLVGFGVGGGVAQTLATRLYRDGVAKLALVNSYAYQTAFAPDWPLPEMAKHQDLEAPQHMSQEQVIGELKQTLPTGSARGLSAQRVDAYAAEWNSKLGKNMLLQHVRLLNSLYMNAVASDVIKLDIPLLLIWGERDAVTPPSLGQRIAREAKHATLEIVPGAGHLILDDSPDQVGQLLARFVAQG